jgi:hypothetical protein
MMSYRDMQRRLEQLEATRAEQERGAQRAWLESLSDADLLAHIEKQRPGFTLVEDALNEAEWDRLCAGAMSDAEWLQVRQRAHSRIGL